MKKSFIAIIIILGVSSIIFAAWAKFMHKEYADAALTIGFIFEGVISSIAIFFLLMWLRKKANYN